MCDCGKCLTRDFSWVPDDEWISEPSSQNKAGIFIYNPIKKNFLLVQNAGNYWSIPKGSINDITQNETPIDCAMRETLEETGLNIKLANDANYNVISTRNKKTYIYIYIIDSYDIKLDDTIMSDVSGITWVCSKCINKLSNKHNKKGKKAINLVTSRYLTLLNPDF